MGLVGVVPHGSQEALWCGEFSRFSWLVHRGQQCVSSNYCHFHFRLLPRLDFMAQLKVWPWSVKDVPSYKGPYVFRVYCHCHFQHNTGTGELLYVWVLANLPVLPDMVPYAYKHGRYGGCFLRDYMECYLASLPSVGCCEIPGVWICMPESVQAGK